MKKQANQREKSEQSTLTNRNHCLRVTSVVALGPRTFFSKTEARRELSFRQELSVFILWMGERCLFASPSACLLAACLLVALASDRQSVNRHYHPVSTTLSCCMRAAGRSWLVGCLLIRWPREASKHKQKQSYSLSLSLSLCCACLGFKNPVRGEVWVCWIDGLKTLFAFVASA